MKIGFDAKRAYHNYTGLGNYSRDLIQSLLAYYPNNQYHLYSPKNSNNARLKFIKNHNNISEYFPKTKWYKLFKGLWRSIYLEKLLIQDELDIYHGLSNEIPKRIKGSKVKSIVTIHDLIFRRYPNTYKSIDRKIYDKKFKYAALNSDKIIAISEQTKRDIVEFYNVSPSKIEVIYQTCHHNFKTQCSDEFKEKVRQKYNLPNEFLLNVGTIEKRKNLNVLIQAIPTMKNNLTIVVVGGKTKYYDFLLSEIRRLNIDKNRVLFLENVSIEELPAIYQMAKIFVYPSVFEGFGIPIIEALYSKTPVITTEGGCFSEAGGVYSIYVNTQDATALGNAIDQLLTNKAQQEKMILEGTNYVSKFDSKTLTNQLYSLYESMQ